MALNVTTAVFGENCNTATATPSLAQWDQGQKLKIEGVDLPASYQVEFSTAYTRNAIQQIGDTDGVTIPNELLQRSAPITAYIVLHGSAGSRDTEYWVTIHITPRTPPETVTPDPEEMSVIDQTIAALQEGVADAEASASAAAGSETAADGSAEDAEAWAVGQRAGEDVPDTDPTYHNNSKYYAGRAEAAAEEAGQHEASWETWARRAETAAGAAEGSATAAGQSKTAAEAAAQTATQKATEAGNSAAAAAGSASSARQTVDGAIGAINTARDGALTAIGSAGSNAVGAVEQAGTMQTGRVTTEGNTQVNRVQSKGDEVIGSIPQDYSDLAAEVSDLNRQISENFDRITKGVFTPVLEVGSINLINNTITYPEYKYRVRTAQGAMVQLHAGDVIGLTTYTDARFLAFWSVNGVWSSSGWKTSDLTVAVDAEYIFLLAKVTEDTSVVYTDPAQIGFTIRITDKNTTVSQLTELSDEIDDINDTVVISETIPNVLVLTSGRIYRYFGRLSIGGTLAVTAMPTSTRYGLQGFSDAAYTTKIFDSGWKTSVPYTSPTIDTSLYYRIVIANYDYSDITDVTVGDALVVVNTYTIQDDVNSLRAEINERVAQREMYQSQTVKSIAHRGDFDTAPQCTAPAYLLARKNGFKYAENDVNLSKDGEFVMWHDTTLSRLGEYLADVNGYLMYTDGTDFYYVNNGTVYTWNGTDYVTSAVSIASLTQCAGADYSTITLNLDVLKRIDFGAYKGDHYKGTTILTFAEWVMLCKQLGMELYIDSKITYTQEIVATLTTTLRRAGMLSKATWININTTTVADLIRSQDSTARMGILVNPTAQLIEQWAPYNTGRGFFFDGNAKVITQADVQLGLEAGFEVEAYYVEYVGQTENTILNRIATFIGYGVTGLTLDAYRVEDTIALLS